jgi:hypothetical protein
VSGHGFSRAVKAQKKAFPYELCMDFLPPA